MVDLQVEAPRDDEKLTAERRAAVRARHAANADRRERLLAQRHGVETCVVAGMLLALTPGMRRTLSRSPLRAARVASATHLHLIAAR